MFRRLGFSAGCLLMATTSSYAILGLGDIVHDPINLVQNTATAIRSWTSNVNEVTQINNQLKQLIDSARQLAALPMSVADEITGTFAEYNNLLNQGRGLLYAVQQSAAQFEALYHHPSLASAPAVLGQVQQASAVATQAQAIFERLCKQESQLSRLLAASKTAPGTKAAQQATNELLGVLADQGAALAQVQAATGRMEVSKIMQEVSAQKQARQNAQTYMQLQEPEPWTRRTSQGFRLPD